MLAILRGKIYTNASQQGFRRIRVSLRFPREVVGPIKQVIGITVENGKRPSRYGINTGKVLENFLAM